MLWVMIKKEMCLCGPLTGFRLSAGNLRGVSGMKNKDAYFSSTSRTFLDIRGDIKRLLDKPVASLVHDLLRLDRRDCTRC